MFTFIHAALIGLGSTLIVLGILVSLPKPDDKIQPVDILDSLWERSGGWQTRALSRHEQFFRSLTLATGNLLDHLFGPKLISIQSISISIALSMSSAGFAASLFVPKQRHQDFPFALAATAATIMLATPGIFNPRQRSILSIVVIVGYLYGIFGGWQTVGIIGTCDVLVAVLLGIGSDIAFVILYRKLIKYTSGRSSWVRILSNLFFGIAAALGLCMLPPIVATIYHFPHSLRICAGEMAALNLADFIVSVMIMVVALSMVLHISLWDIVRRVINRYRAEERMVELGRILIYAGIGLVLIGNTAFGRWLRELWDRVDKLAV